VSVSSLVISAATRPVALGLSLLGLAGGHAAYEASAKRVSITVDGQRQHVTTHGSTVGDVLAAAHVFVGAHDLLAPARSTKLTDSTVVIVRRGREMTLTVDGAQRTLWVTAMSVDEALSQIGLREPGSLLSADRSREIPLKGFSLDVRTRKDVQLLDGGNVRHTATNALVVSDVLRELRVHVRPNDRLSVASGSAVRDGLVIRVTRLDGHRISEDAPVPFGVVRRPDSSMYVGDSKVLRAGRVGVVHRTYLLSYVNHKLASRRLATVKRTAQPVTKIVAYGTKARPQAPRSVSGADGLNWGALANCESGGNPRAVSSNGQYRGLYQFSMGTWHGVGGSGDPIDASSSEQTYRAKVLYQRAGRSPWPVCGKYL
jgi:uncharacterized protein YabE (DUF348 family)